MNESVFSMIQTVLGDARKKTAAASAQKVPVSQPESIPEPEKTAAASGFTDEGLDKLASACDFLADNLHDVLDQRSPQEKLAELGATQDALRKLAMEGGDKAHQTQKANSESDPPATVSTNSSGTAPGGSNAIPSEETNTPGTSLEAGQSGEATPAHVTPKSTEPTESPNAQDASNAMNTNKEMMMPDQPEDILKQAMAISKLAAEGRITPQVANAMLQKRAAPLPPALAAKASAVKANQNPAKPGAETAIGGSLAKAASAIMDKEYNFDGMSALQVETFVEKAAVAATLLEKAAEAGTPPSMAMSMIRARGDAIVTKLAEDAINPASISGGTEPLLQSSPGVPSALNQGSEPGENTPRETAPTSGQGSGRDALSSNEAAINVTKGTAKGPQKGALSEVLTEPALSSAHDKVLSESLDNTSSAGVKISAAKELLRKFAAQSPKNALLVKTLHKMAQEGELPDEVAEEAAAGPMPVPEAGPEAAGLEGAPSEEALAAVEAGVTPEELEVAEALLAEQAGDPAAEAAMPPEGMPPEGMPPGMPPEGIPPAMPPVMPPEGVPPEEKASQMPQGAGQSSNPMPMA